MSGDAQVAANQAAAAKLGVSIPGVGGGNVPPPTSSFNSSSMPVISSSAKTATSSASTFASEGSTTTPAGGFDPNAYTTTTTGEAQNIYQTTVAAAHSDYSSALSAENDNYAAQKATLDQQMQDAIQSETAAVLASDPNANMNSPQVAGIAEKVQERFQSAYDTLNAQHSTNLTSLASTLNDNVTNASTAYQNAVIGIETNAANMQVSTQQQAYTDFLNGIKTVGSLDLSSPEGSSAAIALVQKGVQSGMSIDSALALVKSGSLAAQKADQSTWLANLKSVDLSGMTNVSLADAQKDPLLGMLISQGAQVMGSPEAAYEALQNSAIQQKQTLDLEKEQVSIEATTANEQLRYLTAGRTTATAMVNEFEKGAFGKSLESTAFWMPNVEASYNQLKSGNYSSALTFLDAIVKLNTGGQAIRQGQTSIQMDSATFNDYLQTLASKYGISASGLSFDQYGNLQGATPQLSSTQVQQMFQDATAIASERAKEALPTYQAYKNGIETTAASDPSPDQVTGIASNIPSIDAFYNTYGTGGGSSGSGGSSATPSQVMYQGTMYNVDSSGNMTPAQ